MFSASTSSCYPQIVSLDENAELQSVISDVLLTHNCDMDDVNVDGWILVSGAADIWLKYQKPPTYMQGKRKS
jgi:hypothetical protein